MSRAKRSPIVLSMALCAAALVPFEAACAQQDVVLAIERAFERLAASREFWPGFRPAMIPLAVYDGERTFLFRHPAPPDGFEPLRGALPKARVFAGRYPVMVANTSVQIGGVVTATLMLPPGDRPVERLAAVALHESFHVHRRVHHPRWAADEAGLFVYPVDDAEALAMRRLESRALRAALEAQSIADARCWARAALAERAQRYAAIGAAPSAYERGTELNEGLASYVEAAANGDETPTVFDDGADITDVRRRAYASGAALAMLLDRFSPGWKQPFDGSQSGTLDASLAASLSAGSKAAPCEFPAADVAAARARARGDVAALLERRREQRAEFDSRPGWRITVVAAEGEPLWPKGFDPLNATVVEGGVLHTRFLKIGNDAGELEAMESEGAEIDSLTIGTGPHPLFDGLRRAVILGSAEPTIEVQRDTVIVHAPGVAARFRGASVIRGDHEAVVRLGARP
jgi:hypothetical protein